MTPTDLAAVLDRILAALEAAREVADRYTPGSVAWEQKDGDDRWDPVTEADEALDRLLKARLLEPGEGWLSEETVDDPSRLDATRVWVVDPLDGTREFIQGIPEWCISVALVEEGVPVAGGILNPASDELILGAEGLGVTLNGRPVTATGRTGLDGAVVLASRSEVKRGEWERFSDAPFEVRPCGSVAYKLGLVGAGKADATWTLVPKHEWDVAAGAALVRASGGVVLHADGTEPRFNQRDPKLPNFLAGPRELLKAFRERWMNPESGDVTR